MFSQRSSGHIVSLFVAAICIFPAAAYQLGSVVLSFDKTGQSQTIQLPQSEVESRGIAGALENLTEYLIAVAETEQQGYDPQYFAICSIVKDQHKDMREWIEHHKSLGCAKFYILDHNSTVPMSAVLEDYIISGLVEYINVTGVDFELSNKKLMRPQMYAYNLCLQDYRHNHSWMAFIDVDEFFIIKDETPSLPALLKDYEQYGALGVNWVMFGSSGHVTRPKAGVRNSYFKCLPPDHKDNLHIKTIVNTKLVGDTPPREVHMVRTNHTLWNVFQDPHAVVHPIGDGHFTVDENFQRVSGARTETTSHKRIALYHYVTKSLEDFEEKSARGSAMNNHKTIEFMQLIDSEATSNCTDAMHDTTTLTVSIAQTADQIAPYESDSNS